MANGFDFNGSPVRVTVVEDDCCNEQEDSSFIAEAFKQISNTSLTFVGCSKIGKTTRAIKKETELIFVPFLKGCNKDGSQIISQIRDERNGIPIVAYGKDANVDMQEMMFKAGADYVGNEAHLFSKENLFYLVHSRARKN